VQRVLPEIDAKGLFDHLLAIRVSHADHHLVGVVTLDTIAWLRTRPPRKKQEAK
jgi:hypothetical protein